MLLTSAKTAVIVALSTTTLVALLIACQGCSQAARGSAADPARAIEISTGSDDGEPLSNDLLAVGTLTQGGLSEQPIWFCNRSRVARRITGFVSSCECLTISGLPAELAAGASAAAHVRIDLQDERSFTGDVEVVVMVDVAEADALPLKVGFTVEAAREPAGVTRRSPRSDLAGVPQ